MSSLGRDWGEILSRLNTSWGVKEVANIMSILNKRTTPIEEDQSLRRHVLYSPFVDLHNNGRGMTKYLPASPRAYVLTHDNTNAKQKLETTRIIFEGNLFDQVGSNHGTWTGIESYSDDVPVDGNGDDIGKKSVSISENNTITLANEGNFDFAKADPFSFSMWVKAPSIASQTFLYKQTSGAGFNLATNATPKFVFTIETATPQTNSVTSTTTPVADTWYHVVCTKGSTADQDEMKIYVNGSLEATGSTQTMTGNVQNNEAVKIGATTGLPQVFAGQVADFHFWNVELNASDVKKAYQNTCGITFDNPEWYKHMGGAKTDGASYMTIADHSWFDVNDLVIAVNLYLPATATGDGIQTITEKSGTFAIQVDAHATAENQIRCSTTNTTAKEITFTYTPDTWFTLLLHSDSTNITVWKDNVQQGQVATGAVPDTNANDVSIWATTTGTQYLKAGSLMSWLVYADKDIDTDSQWRTDYDSNSILDLEDAAATEITTIPFIGDVSEMPNDDF